MERADVRTVRLDISSGQELRVSLWRTNNGEPGALVLTKTWPEDSPAVTRREAGQVAVPGEVLPDLVGALKGISEGGDK